MPVAAQPADVTPRHRIDLPDPPELPAQQGARRRRHRERLGIRRLDPVVGAHVDDHAGPVSPPGEVVRGVPPPTTLTRPVQPERLRCDTGDLRVEIERPDMITLQPGLIAHMPAGRRCPPPAREMPSPRDQRNWRTGIPSSNRTPAHAGSGARRSTPPSMNPSSNPEPASSARPAAPVKTDIT